MGHVTNHMTILYKIRLAPLQLTTLDILGATHIARSTDFTTTHEYTTGILRDYVLHIVLRVLGVPT